MPEKVTKFYTADLKLRVSTVVTTELTKDTVEMQDMFPMATINLSQALTGCILVASHLRKDEKLAMNFSGDGPLGLLIAECSFEGQFRAYCENPHADLRLPDGQLDLAGGMGHGLLTVARTVPFQKHPITGIVPLETGFVGEDIAHYLFQSNQTRCVLAVTCSVSSTGQVEVAGGVLIEALPGTEQAYVDKLQERVNQARPLSEALKNDISGEGLARLYLPKVELKTVEHPYPLTYVCRCSDERVERAMILQGKESLAELLVRASDTTVVCQFCAKNYIVPIERLRQLYKEAFGSWLH